MRRAAFTIVVIGLVLVGLAGVSFTRRIVSLVGAGKPAGGHASAADSSIPVSLTTRGAGNEPELPRVLLDTALVEPTGKTLKAASSEEFQAALEAARPGDSIVLGAGVTFMAPSDGFVLPAKSGGGWITIRTSDLAGLPAVNHRVVPTDNSRAMPKLVSRDNQGALKTAPRARNYRLIGLEFTVAPSVKQNSGIVQLGNAGETELTSVPADLIIDRCYIHGTPTGDTRRGIALNSARTAIIDSYISEIHDRGSDAQAICGWNGPGPFKIVDNYLEASGENVMFGGADPAIKDLVASDIEFSRNLAAKPLSWKPGEPGFAGITWAVKNLFELKSARRVLIEGNIFENNWSGAQTGFALVLKSTNQDGAAPWSITEHVIVRNNIVRHSGSGLNLLGRENQANRPTNHILIANNLFQDIDGKRWGGSGIFLQMADVIDLKVDHNTVFQSGNFITVYGESSPGFVYTNNIISHNTYGMKGDGTGVGSATLKAFCPAAVFTNNLIVALPSDVSRASYPPNNYFADSFDQIHFQDLSKGDYRLANASPYRRNGSDGSDIGCNIDALTTAAKAALVGLGGASKTNDQAI